MIKRRTLAIPVILFCLIFLGYSLIETSKAQTVVSTISGKFYKLDVLATNVSMGVGLLEATSLNDNGVVAFVNTTRLYTADGIGPVRTIVPGSVGFDQFIGGQQINNNNLLLAYSQNATSGSRRLTRYDTNLPEPSETTIANSFVDFIPTRMSVTMNNHNQVQHAFYATPRVAGPPQQIVTGQTGAFSGVPIATDPDPNSLVRPMIADNGNVVVRAGTTNTSPIRLYNYSLTTPVDIATVSPTTFSALGRSPGISDDGAVVVFYGVLNANPGTNPNPNYNQTIQTTAGPGIFASYEIGGGTRRIVRIARRQVENFFGSSGNQDGVCDLPEQSGPPTPPPGIANPMC